MQSNQIKFNILNFSRYILFTFNYSFIVVKAEFLIKKPKLPEENDRLKDLRSFRFMQSLHQNSLLAATALL